MSSWSIHSTWDATTFSTTVPFHSMELLFAGFWIAVILLNTIKSGRGLRNTVIVGCALGAFGFLMYGSELTLDRTSGTATLREFEYYHWSTRTWPLDDIDRLYVSTGSTTSQLRIQFKGGSVRAIDFLDQNGGKDEAAYAAKRWLGKAE